MFEKESAPGPASPERAYECVLSKQSHSKSGEHHQCAKRRNLDAAVISADHPEAHWHGRLVPEGAHAVMLGGAIGGYFKANRSKYVLRSCRAHEIERLFIHRHPASEGVLPLPEDEIVFARALVAHATPVEARSALIRWGVEMTADVERILGDPKAWGRKFNAETLGSLLGLTEEERGRLGITTFRAAGQTAADQAEARRAKDRERKRAERARRACGTVRHISTEKRRPWDAAAISRSKWYALGLNKHGAKKVSGGWTGSVRSKEREGVGADKTSPKTETFVLRSIAEPRSLDHLVEVTGLPRERIKVALSRLKAAGKARQVRRGVWLATDTAATGGLKAAAQSINEPSTGSGKPACPFVDKTEDGRSEIDRLASALRMLIRGSATKDIASIGRRASVRLPSTTIFSNHDAERLGR